MLFYSTPLMAAMGRKQAILIGHDWGGAVAWWTASKFPEHVAKMVILNAPLHAVMKKHLRQNWRQLRKSWYMFFFQIPGLPEACMRAGTWLSAACAAPNSRRRFLPRSWIAIARPGRNRARCAT